MLRRISERIWLPGGLVPGEAKLAEEFGCARATVNRAMRELANSGLVNRRRKAGTRVAINPVRKATLDIPVTRLEIERRGATYRHALLEMKETIPPPLISIKMDLAKSTKLLHLRALHFADNLAFLYEDRWVNPAVVPAIRDVDFNTISANEWLVQNTPFTTGDISFSAANASAEEAEYLGADEGAAIFIVERMTRSGSNTITSVRLAYAPGFQMFTTI